MTDLSMVAETPLVLCDNQATIPTSVNENFFSIQTKHIDIKLKFCEIKLPEK